MCVCVSACAFAFVFRFVLFSFCFVLFGLALCLLARINYIKNNHFICHLNYLAKVAYTVFMYIGLHIFYIPRDHHLREPILQLGSVPT